MKPLKLSLQAFGPFAGREEIDFTLLPEGALFLISGPTGAGKTSILDGITYALYGDTSGGERSAREMRSHHADAALLTEVEFEFALGARRYRVRRVPEQERAAQRATKSGDGLVKVLARAELHRLDDDGVTWLPLAHKTTEVTSELTALLGCQAEQFRQVVLLPQGQFRKLLTASSGEREKILETLFGTAAYKRLQDALKQEAQALQKAADETRLRRDTLLQQAAAESVEGLRGQAEALDAELTRLAGEESAARSADTAAQAALQQGRALAAQFAEQHTAGAALAAVEARAGEIAALRQREAAARRALQVVPADEACAGAGRQLALARQRAAEAGERVATAAAAMQQARAGLEADKARAPQRDTAQRELLQLEALAAQVEQLATAERELAARRSQAAAAEQALAQARHAAAEAEQGRAALVVRVDQLAPRAAEAEALALRVAQAEQREADAQRLAARRKALAEATAAEAQARQAMDAARAALDAARDAQQALDGLWREAQAAILARHLHDGAPCPVCGSAVHPGPATHAGELPSESALREAAARSREAEQGFEARRAAFDRAAQARTAVEAEVGALAGALRAAGDDGVQADMLVETAADLRQRLAVARQAGAELTAARDRLQALEQAQRNALAAQEQAATAAQSAASALHGAERVVEARREAVPAALRPAGALAAALKTARSALDTLLAASQQAQAAHAGAEAALAAAHAQRDTLAQAETEQAAALEQAQVVFARALAAAAFDDEAGYRAARLAAADIDRLAASLRQHDEDAAAARERLARADQAVAGRTPPQLAELETSAQAARAAIDAVLARSADLRGALEKTRYTLALLDELAARNADIEARYRITGELAAIANGDNGRNLTFQRYVLAALLDDVLRAASLRLKAMSRGRYLLQRREEVADARRAAGLDLEVLDDYTGRARPVATLSGGEGFMASLSLALGLSDVVQAYAGGVQLDTLFIDEGFGSLDPESLDMAMRTLIDLQRQGRMVGVISHVEEMKQQIDVAIEVVQGVRGSRVRVRG
ncbi:exonuclease SbcC [Azoarcus olearius]|uniref:AAA family ATPase n=1 Tax=Azoarcus sp. (strain BH72) TaxID=418699 RepID=UPI0008063CA7|nr:SMC family ATPase [Azoarcus olearius]ANQ83291.1 exonuclease SbcC [Azoarcus olearius]